MDPLLFPPRIMIGFPWLPCPIQQDVRSFGSPLEPLDQDGHRHGVPGTIRNPLIQWRHHFSGWRARLCPALGLSKRPQTDLRRVSRRLSQAELKKLAMAGGDRSGSGGELGRLQTRARGPGWDGSGVVVPWAPGGQEVHWTRFHWE